MSDDNFQENFKSSQELVCINEFDQRECPKCGFTTIKGMPGGRDANCKNCGYKDPCCNE